LVLFFGGFWFVGSEKRASRRVGFGYWTFGWDTHDQAIAGILDAIRQLMAPPPEPAKRPIGFITDEQ